MLCLLAGTADACMLQLILVLIPIRTWSKLYCIRSNMLLARAVHRLVAFLPPASRYKHRLRSADAFDHIHGRMSTFLWTGRVTGHASITDDLHLYSGGHPTVCRHPHRIFPRRLISDAYNSSVTLPAASSTSWTTPYSSTTQATAEHREAKRSESWTENG